MDSKILNFVRNSNNYFCTDHISTIQIYTVTTTDFNLILGILNKHEIKTNLQPVESTYL